MVTDYFQQPVNGNRECPTTINRQSAGYFPGIFHAKKLSTLYQARVVRGYQ
jgi:hypothetical protein